jgi:membrane associated rhomboid family serine protease
VIRPRFWLPPAVVLLLVINVAVEAVLLAADHRLLGSPVWRPFAYQYGGFWSGLLRDWTPNYPLQAVAMFATYPWLHAGPGHLLGNMAVLAVVGRHLEKLFGSRRFLIVYALSALAGGGAFGLLSTSPAPMVGASGALFGLAAAALRLDWMSRRSRLGLAGALVGLLLLNLASWILTSGHVAWQTHLGGCVAGWLAARPRWSRSDRGSPA